MGVMSHNIAELKGKKLSIGIIRIRDFGVSDGTIQSEAVAQNGRKCLQVVFGEGPASGVDKEVAAKSLVRRDLAKRRGTKESVGWCWGGAE